MGAIGARNRQKDAQRLAAVMLVMSCALPEGLEAHTESDEARLEAIQREIDEEDAAGNRKSHVLRLAWQFHVPASVVEELYARKRNWGSIAVELAMAQFLSKTNGATYPRVLGALQRIEALHGKGLGRGAIARELGVTPAAVIRDMHRVRQALREERAGPQAHPRSTHRTVSEERSTGAAAATSASTVYRTVSNRRPNQERR
jgi:hypothetical protein